MFKRISTILVFCFCVLASNAQELNCTVDVNSDQIGRTNKQIFQTLKTSLADFVNKKKWTNQNYTKQERIECGITFVITAQEGNNFAGTLQVNAVRPVYGTSYKSPIFNFKDNNISFEYVEFAPLVFNSITYESNLISLISFYVYTILGVDADTFSEKGGEGYYKQALDIALLAQQGGADGWVAKRNIFNRFGLIDQLLTPAYSEYRLAMYNYHIKGFDVFVDDKKAAQQEIYNAVLLFQKLYTKDQNSFLIRTFFDAKSDEIVDVFSTKTEIDTSNLERILSQISSTNNSKWKKIK